MKGNEFARIASHINSSGPELADYRFNTLVTFADMRFSSFYDLLEAVNLLAEDPKEKQEYLEYLIGDAHKEIDILQKQLEKLKKGGE